MAFITLVVTGVCYDTSYSFSQTNDFIMFGIIVVIKMSAAEVEVIYFILDIQQYLCRRHGCLCWMK